MNHQTSFWETSQILKTFDFAIVGAGLSGKQIAINLKKKYSKARVCIIDRAPFSYGASTKNAGFTCFGSISELIMDHSNSTENDILELLEKRYLGIKKILGLCGQKNVAYYNSGSYEVFEKEVIYQSSFEKIQYWNNKIQEKTGLKSTYNEKQIQKLGTHFFNKAIYNPHEGGLDSGLLNQKLTEMVLKKGIIPMMGCNIDSINKTTNGYELKASNGLSFSAHKLIIANNAFAKILVPHLDIEPARGQIILTKPLENLKLKAVFHADNGYIYFRNIGNRLLLGGARNKFMEQEKTHEIDTTENMKDYLTKYINKWILPNKTIEVDQHWSGIMAMGKTKTPIVEKIDENLFVCVRMGGMGLALSAIASEDLVKLL